MARGIKKSPYCFQNLFHSSDFKNDSKFDISTLVRLSASFIAAKVSSFGSSKTASNLSSKSARSLNAVCLLFDARLANIRFSSL